EDGIRAATVTGVQTCALPIYLPRHGDSIQADPRPDPGRPRIVLSRGESRPVVVAGAHGQSLFLRAERVPREGETVLGSGFEEPEIGRASCRERGASLVAGGDA